MDWQQLLASITRSGDGEPQLGSVYLAVENRILRNELKGPRVLLISAEWKTLAEMGQKLGRQALAEASMIAKPDTLLGCHRTLVVQKPDRSHPRTSLGRPRIDQEPEALVVWMARENHSWGCDRIVGALANLGYRISDQSVGIFKRHGSRPPQHVRPPWPGGSSAGPPWTCWSPQTSSLPRYGYGVGCHQICYLRL